jgi:hypothetical protein
MYINDKNSSTLREWITVIKSGYTHNTHKLGFNGYKQDTFGTTINCEAKPKNINTNNHKISKLDGSGTFNDYTWKRFYKDKASNLMLLVSGFVDGRLIYILEIPFADSLLSDNFERQLAKRLPDGDQPTQYLRSAQFNFRVYKDSPSLRVVFCNSQAVLKDNKPYISQDLYQYLIERFAQC